MAQKECCVRSGKSRKMVKKQMSIEDATMIMGGCSELLGGSCADVEQLHAGNLRRMQASIIVNKRSPNPLATSWQPVALT